MLIWELFLYHSFFLPDTGRRWSWHMSIQPFCKFAFQMNSGLFYLMKTSFHFLEYLKSWLNLRKFQLGGSDWTGLFLLQILFQDRGARDGKHAMWTQDHSELLAAIGNQLRDTFLQSLLQSLILFRLSFSATTSNQHDLKPVYYSCPAC